MHFIGHSRIIAALATSLVILAATAASEPRELNWDDLVPAEAQFDDPFTRLDDDQLFELTLVAQVRDRLEAGEKVGEDMLEDYNEYVESLEAQEVDIDGLLAMREEVTRQRIAKTFLANRQLDGQQVRLPGYLLPLEFDGKMINEFLLVPYVGACIHTPPPPPNQIVHVTIKAGYETGGGLYTPVWVNGLMKTERVESSLSFVDGSSDIPSSYTLEASTVTPYEE
jgi:hypothetical protein